MSLSFSGINPAAADFDTIVTGLLSGGLSLVPGSVTFKGVNNQASLFTGGLDTIGLSTGLLLTSGSGLPPISNTQTGFSTSTGSGSDADLLAAGAGLPGIGSVNDANVITFKVMATSASVTSVTFNFVFGSDEYPEWSSVYSDIGAILVNGTNVAFFSNGKPLAVINDNLAAGAFQNNTGGSIALEYDGISAKLSVTAALQPGENTIKIGVADSNDSALDTALFVGTISGGQETGGGTITQPPVAEDDTATTTDPLPVVIDVLGNDGDADGVIASYGITTGPTNGTAAFNPDGTMTYTPNAGFSGTDTIVYSVTDDDGASDTATVTVTVLPGETEPPSSCPTVDRPGTVDGSSSAAQILTGPGYHNTFFFDIAAATGKDVITNFESDDILAVKGKLYDGNDDGFITFGKNGLLNLDGPDVGADTVKFEGLDATKGLRYLGEACDGINIYAETVVRPKGAIEGLISDSALSGGVGDKKADAFFFDTALDIFLGHDTIKNFGMKDVLVTTTKVFDGNGDNIIDFGDNGLLDLPGGLGGPGDPGMKGETGTVGISGMGGGAITSLEFDGHVEHDGVDYYVYSLVGSVAGTANLMFA